LGATKVNASGKRPNLPGNFNTLKLKKQGDHAQVCPVLITRPKNDFFILPEFRDYVASLLSAPVKKQPTFVRLKTGTKFGSYIFREQAHCLFMYCSN